MAVIFNYFRHLWLRVVIWRYYMSRLEDWDEKHDLQQIADMGNILPEYAFYRYRHRIGEGIRFTAGFETAGELMAWFAAATAAVEAHEYLDNRPPITGALMNRSERILSDFMVNLQGGVVTPQELVPRLCEALQGLEEAISSEPDPSWQRMYRRKLASGYWTDLCNIMEALTNAAITYE